MRPQAKGVAALLASFLLVSVAVVGAVAAMAALNSQGSGNAGLRRLAPSTVPSTAPSTPSGPVPAIGLTRTATPSELPFGGGRVDFVFLVTNPGNVALSSVKLTDAKCSAVKFNGGDTNSNNRLDPGETWRYTCGGRLSATSTDTATATGVYGSAMVRDSDQITVPVGLKRPALHLETAVSPEELPPGGGTAAISYVVTNVGNVTIAGVSVADRACSPVEYDSGDANRNSLLEQSETWLFSCSTTISTTTTGNARVSGNVKGSGLHDDATETLVVATSDAAIQIAAGATPSSLPAGGGTVTYTYALTNTGDVALTDVAVASTGCAAPALAGGDANADSRLDPTETWRFTCSVVVSTSISATATASALGPLGTLSATATSSVTVAPPAAHTPAISISVAVEPTTLPAGGGSAVYTYTVANRGDVPLAGVGVTDSHCQGVRRATGDSNADGLLDVTETWVFMCLTGIFTTTTDGAAVTGQFAGQIVTASASTTVIVTATTTTPSASPRATPTPTPTPTASPAPTATPTATAAPTESPTASPTDSQHSQTSGPSAPIGGSVAGATSPPRPTADPGQVGTGSGGSTPSVPGLILIGLIGIGATMLILRLANRGTTR